MAPALDSLESDLKIMFDLRTENEDLRRQVVALEFGPSALNNLLADVNDTGLTEICKCSGCFIAKRFSEVEPEELTVRFTSSEVITPCILQKCFLFHCDRLGLFYEIHNIDEESNPDPEDMDCHIVIVDKGLCWEVEYGSKLSLDTLYKNPDLPQLKSLFTIIDFRGDFFKVDGKDYLAMAEHDDEACCAT